MGSGKILDLCGFAHGRRQWPRQLMLLSARLITVTSECPVRIRDLSRGGARVEGWDLPPVATDILLKRGAFEAFGTIAWIADNHCGIQFEAELPDEMFEAIERPQPGQDSSTGQPGFGSKISHHGRLSDGSGWIS